MKNSQFLLRPCIVFGNSDVNEIAIRRHGVKAFLRIVFGHKVFLEGKFLRLGIFSEYFSIDEINASVDETASN